MIDSIVIRSHARDFLDRNPPLDHDDDVGYLARFARRLVDDEVEALIETAREDATTKTDEEVRRDLLDETEYRLDEIAREVESLEKRASLDFVELKRRISVLHLWIKKERP